MNRLWLILLPFLMVSSAWAEEEIKLDEVVVTATRYEERLPDIPAHVTVITEEDIQNSPAQNIPDLLRTEAGIHVYDFRGKPPERFRRFARIWRDILFECSCAG